MTNKDNDNDINSSNHTGSSEEDVAAVFSKCQMNDDEARDSSDGDAPLKVLDPATAKKMLAARSQKKPRNSLFAQAKSQGKKKKKQQGFVWYPRG